MYMMKIVTASGAVFNKEVDIIYEENGIVYFEDDYGHTLLMVNVDNLLYAEQEINNE